MIVTFDKNSSFISTNQSLFIDMSLLDNKRDSYSKIELEKTLFVETKQDLKQAFPILLLKEKSAILSFRGLLDIEIDVGKDLYVVIRDSDRNSNILTKCYLKYNSDKYILSVKKKKLFGRFSLFEKNYYFSNKKNKNSKDIPLEFSYLSSLKSDKYEYVSELFHVCYNYGLSYSDAFGLGPLARFIENEMDSMFGKENWIWEFILFFESNTHKKSFCAPFLLYELQFNNKEDYIEYEDVFDGCFEFEV